MATEYLSFISPILATLIFVAFSIPYYYSNQIKTFLNFITETAYNQLLITYQNNRDTNTLEEKQKFMQDLDRIICFYRDNIKYPKIINRNSFQGLLGLCVYSVLLNFFNYFIDTAGVYVTYGSFIGTGFLISYWCILLVFSIYKIHEIHEFKNAV